MDWVFAAGIFVAQLICCIYVRRPLLRLLPTFAAAAVMMLTLLLGAKAGALGLLGAFLLLWAQGKSLLMAGLAWLLYKLVLFTK